MPPRRLRTLIVGLAMTILGPVLGYAIQLVLLVHAAQPGQVNQSITAAFAQLQQLPGQLLVSLIPLMLGALCGAAGFFLVTATLVIHFLGPDTCPISPRGMPRQAMPSSQPVTSAKGDDSRYMPKFR
jgi:hypothetical protein